jgi:hypothetical protein
MLGFGVSRLTPTYDDSFCLPLQIMTAFQYTPGMNFFTRRA